MLLLRPQIIKSAGEPISGLSRTFDEVSLSPVPNRRDSPGKTRSPVPSDDPESSKVRENLFWMTAIEVPPRDPLDGRGHVLAGHKLSVFITRSMMRALGNALVWIALLVALP